MSEQYVLLLLVLAVNYFADLHALTQATHSFALLYIADRHLPWNSILWAIFQKVCFLFLRYNTTKKDIEIQAGLNLGLLNAGQMLLPTEPLELIAAEDIWHLSTDTVQFHGWISLFSLVQFWIFEFNMDPSGMHVQSIPH